LDFESVMGQGTKFRLRLPLAEVRGESSISGNDEGVAETLGFPSA